jgi:hypothetical protein
MFVVHVVVVFLDFECVCVVSPDVGEYLLWVFVLFFIVIYVIVNDAGVRPASYLGARRLYVTSVVHGCGVFVRS